MWALRPACYDNDMPIDLRKKVVLQRDLEREQKESSRRSEDALEPRDYSLNRYKDRCHEPPQHILPVQKLSPFMSERYGVRCSLVNPEDNRCQDLRPGSRGTLETAIRKLHFNSQLKQAYESGRGERCRSIDALLENKNSAKEKSPVRSSSCPNLRDLTLKPPKCHQSTNNHDTIHEIEVHDHQTDTTPIRYSNSIRYSQVQDEYHETSPVVGGARKRKSFTPIYGDRIPSPRKSPEHHPYEEYFSHPEALLRQQLHQHSRSPYLLHVYDYYQQLVQRLREHSSTNLRMHVPDSPTSTEDDMQLDAQRKRPCRALTGKHVKQGTGASISTLLTLRQKIQERQKAKEDQPRSILIGSKKMCPSKKNTSKKPKQTSKASLNKINNF